MFRLFVLTLLLIFFSSCSRLFNKGTGDHQPDSSDEYVPLSAEQAQKLTTPTIYYIPQSTAASTSCEAADLREMKDTNANVITRVCSSFLKFCILQGTCKVSVNSASLLLRYSEFKNNEYRFTQVDQKVCPYGYGVKKICVDPFYSVAADLSLYPAGTVISIPSLVGLQLPDGSLHSGFFIVRDSGRAIKGYGRFDFFTGFITLDKTQNPLTRQGLSWKGTHVPYFIVTGAEAQQVLELRNYPNLPE